MAVLERLCSKCGKPKIRLENSKKFVCRPCNTKAFGAWRLARTPEQWEIYSQSKPPCNKCGAERTWLPNSRKFVCRPCKNTDFQAWKKAKLPLTLEQLAEIEKNPRLCPKCGKPREWLEAYKGFLCVNCRSKENANRAKFRRYGLTNEQIDARSRDQNDVCMICSFPETRKNANGVVFRLAVDHDPVTGKIRDLLCRRCNEAIGLLREDISVVRKTLEYLLKHGEA